MRIVFAMLYYDEARAADGPLGYLESIPLHRELGAALAAAGHDVTVVFHFPVGATFEERGVRFQFVAPHRASRAIGALAKRLGRGRAFYEPAFGAIEAIVRAEADIVHFHGTAMPVNLALLAARLDGAALVVQHHGGGPANSVVTRAMQRFGLGRAGRVVFTSAAHAVPFVSAGLLDLSRVATAIEVSTPLEPLPVGEARRRSGLTGDPVFVSAGRLHPDKDPFTVLRGFEIIAQSWPGSRLYLCYLTDELLPALRRHVEARPALVARVRFLGRVPHDQMDAILGSADFLLQASLREWSGYAVLEAMAAGALPVVTRIAAFEAITGGGQQGILFPPGDAEALARGVLALDRNELPTLRTGVRAYFEANLSFAALARRLETIYQPLLRQ
jgi:glycosyltransferase involved in cell wall biosynthesis